MGFKVQINSQEALERLIGGDKEMEISIKNAILNNIVNKHLKSITNSEISMATESAIKKYLNQTDYCGLVKHDWHLGYIATDKLKSLIKNKVEEMVDALIIETVKEIMPDIKAKVEFRLGTAVDSATNRVSEANIDELVKRRIRRMLE